MRYFQTFARFVLRLPAIMRIGIIVLCTLGCQALFILSTYLCSLDNRNISFFLSPLEQNPCVLAIPIVVASWFYRKRGLWFCLSSLIIMTGIFYAWRFSHLVTSREFLISFFTGVVALLVIGLFVSNKRDALERAEESKRQLAWAYNEELRLNKAKDQFLQNVNHELKTPLTSLGASLELLQQRHEHLCADERSNLLQSAASSCEELQILTNTILECLQVNEQEEQHLRIWEIQLGGIIADVLQQTDPGWRLKERVRLEVAEELRVLANGMYLRQLLRNLLSNAVKYTSNHLPILISARRTNNATTLQSEICICIKDWGPGIPPEEASRLFDQFVRLERDALGEVRGSGLGLYVSKNLVGTMGGRIWLESSGIPGEGSSFNFTLPAAPSNPPQPFHLLHSLPGSTIALS